MNNKQLTKMLREKALQAMPEVFDKIDLKTTSIGIRTTNKPRFSLRFPRVVASLLTLMIFGVASYFVFFAPTNNSVLALETDAETFGYQILSGAMFLESESIIEANPLSYTLLSEEETLFETNLDVFNQTFAVLESLIGLKSDLSFQLVESDRAEYKQMIQVSLIALTEDDIAYTIYLNQRLRNRMESFQGIIVFNEGSYTFTYQRHSGMGTSRLTIGTDTDQIVVVMNETAEDVVRFHYQFRENGELVRELHLELTKDGEEIAASVRTSIGGKPVRIGMNRILVEGKPKLQVNYGFGTDEIDETGDVEVESVYDEAQSKYVYRYNGMIRRDGETTTVDVTGQRPPRGNMPDRPTPPGPGGNH
jgi:hypothetical protein